MVDLTETVHIGGFHKKRNTYLPTSEASKRGCRCCLSLSGGEEGPFQGQEENQDLER